MKLASLSEIIRYFNLRVNMKELTQGQIIYLIRRYHEEISCKDSS